MPVVIISPSTPSVPPAAQVIPGVTVYDYEYTPDGQPLAGPKVDRGLADRGGPRGDGDDVARLRVLDRQEHRHQLRQARDRNTGLLAVPGEHLARRGVLDHVRPGVHLREGGESGGRERESRGDSNQRAHHGRKD